MKKTFKEVLCWKGSSFFSEGKQMWPRSELSSDCEDLLNLNLEMGEVLIAPAF